MVQFRQADLPHEQYVFFYIDVFGDSLNSEHRQPWARGDEDDVIAKEAFQVLKSLHKSDSSYSKTQEISNQVKFSPISHTKWTLQAQNSYNFLPNPF